MDRERDPAPRCSPWWPRRPSRRSRSRPSRWAVSPCSTGGASPSAVSTSRWPVSSARPCPSPGPGVGPRTDRTASPVTAALWNGTASHALDYDDTVLALPGHVTAPILPGLLALAETRGAERDVRAHGVRARRRGHVPGLPRAGARALPGRVARHGDAGAARRRGRLRPAARPRRRGDRPRGRTRGGPARRDPRVLRDDGEALPGRPRRGRRAPVGAPGRARA